MNMTLPSTLKTTFACLAITLPSLGMSAVAATPNQWQLNMPKTQVNFSVPYLKKFTVHGKFHDINGIIYYDEKSPEKTTVRFTVKTESIDTDLKPRDLFLRRKELLNTKQYPTMKFVSKSIKLITPREGYVTGDFTALGITKPLTVKVTLNETKSRTPALKFTATGKINRQDYGSTAFPNMIGNIIPINVSGELIPDK